MGQNWHTRDIAPMQELWKSGSVDWFKLLFRMKSLQPSQTPSNLSIDLCPLAFANTYHKDHQPLSLDLVDNPIPFSAKVNLAISGEIDPHSLS